MMDKIVCDGDGNTLSPLKHYGKSPTDLQDDRHEPARPEEPVAKKAAEDVGAVVNLAAGNHVAESHKDERVKDES